MEAKRECVRKKNAFTIDSKGRKFEFDAAGWPLMFQNTEKFERDRYGFPDFSKVGLEIEKEKVVNVKKAKVDADAVVLTPAKQTQQFDDNGFPVLADITPIDWQRPKVTAAMPLTCTTNASARRLFFYLLPHGYTCLL